MRSSQLANEPEPKEQCGNRQYHGGKGIGRRAAKIAALIALGEHLEQQLGSGLGLACSAGRLGSLPSFPRYSPALKSSMVTWDEGTLDAWLRNPLAFIPDNRMIFPGIQDAKSRADLIGFLKQATSPGSETAQAMPDAGGMAGMGGGDPNLKQASPASLVASITYCGDTYDVTTADGKTVQFWERNLRFKTDSSADRPKPGAPAIVGAGMVGDRASAIFAAPEEFGQFIKREC